MANPYFRNLPNFEYVNRSKEGKFISNYTEVKNLFKRGKLREDLFQDLTVFEKYNIKGDDRPDNVAYEIYGDSTLDWVVLLSNNIVNINNECPLTQQAFESYVLDKYGTLAKLDETHHYESNEGKDRSGVIVFPRGVKVAAAQSVSYYEHLDDEVVTVTTLASVPDI